MAFDIEKLIRQKRKELDVESPPEQLWENIESNVRLNHHSQFGLFWKIAAVLFFGTTVTLLIILNSRGTEDNRLATLGDISEEYKALENDYQQVIQLIETELKIEEKHRKEFPWLFEELEILEKVNQQYQQDLKLHKNNDQVIRPLIDYYEKKIKILKRIQLEINRRKNEKDTEINT